MLDIYRKLYLSDIARIINPKTLINKTVFDLDELLAAHESQNSVSETEENTPGTSPKDPKVERSPSHPQLVLEVIKSDDSVLETTQQLSESAGALKLESSTSLDFMGPKQQSSPTRIELENPVQQTSPVHLESDGPSPQVTATHSESAEGAKQQTAPTPGDVKSSSPTHIESSSPTQIESLSPTHIESESNVKESLSPIHVESDVSPTHIESDVKELVQAFSTSVDLDPMPSTTPTQLESADPEQQVSPVHHELGDTDAPVLPPSDGETGDPELQALLSKQVKCGDLEDLEWEAENAFTSLVGTAATDGNPDSIEGDKVEISSTPHLAFESRFESGNLRKAIQV